MASGFHIGQHRSRSSATCNNCLKVDIRLLAETPLKCDHGKGNFKFKSDSVTRCYRYWA